MNNDYVMENYRMLEDTINSYTAIRKEKLRKIASITFKYLGISEIPVNIKYINYPHNLQAYFNTETLEINTFIFDNELTLDQYYIDEHMPNISNWEKSLFTLFHEIAHYLHYFKYRQHFNKLWDIYTGEPNNKIEIIANKIAHILLNRRKLWKI